LEDELHNKYFKKKTITSLKKMMYLRRKSSRYARSSKYWTTSSVLKNEVIC
jgi:hypothetical protein